MEVGRNDEEAVRDPRLGLKVTEEDDDAGSKKRRRRRRQWKSCAVV